MKFYKRAIVDVLIFNFVFLLILLCLGIPLINILAFWLLPLPFFWLKVRHDNRFYFLTAIFFFGFFYSLQMFLLFYIAAFAGIIGTVMGILYKKPQTKGVDVVSGGIATGLVASWILLYVGEYSFGIMSKMEQLWQKMWSQPLPFDFLATMGEIPPLRIFMPLLLFYIIVPSVLLILRIGRKWLAKSEFPGKYLPPFSEWRLPRPFAYAFILFVILYLITTFTNESNSLHPLMSGILLLYTMFVMQGLSFAAFFIKAKQRHRLWMMPLIITTLFFFPVQILFSSLGIVDILMDIREKIKPEDSEKKNQE